MVLQPYVCSALTELSEKEKTIFKRFLSQIGDVCEELTGVRAFVPHEHFDPDIHPHFTPTQVDEAERNQVCCNTSLLIVVAYAPSWGGGIEVEMANNHGVPGILIGAQEKFEARLVSRLLRGNPAIKEEVPYETFDHAIELLRGVIPRYLPVLAPV
ncbi:hypothetical protein CL634_07620 [bacterium]|nr:hypothetical protein [bacterium]|tara:strand:+ start:700 stop:1167 length:468 start_codon:yes stop_codon:yes gene_type:complete